MARLPTNSVPSEISGGDLWIYRFFRPRNVSVLERVAFEQRLHPESAILRVLESFVGKRMLLTSVQRKIFESI